MPRTQLRLTPQQAQEKEGIEESLEELKEALKLEEDDEKKAALEEELKTGQGKLDSLMEDIRVRPPASQRGLPPIGRQPPLCPCMGGGAAATIGCLPTTKVCSRGKEQMGWKWQHLLETL